MNKKVFLILPVLILLAFSASSVRAEKSPATDSSKFKPQKIMGRDLPQDKVASKSALLDQKRADFKTRLLEIKDARKQKIVENLDKSYVNINNRWTTHFKNVLQRLTKIADKIKIVAQKQNNTAALTKIDQIYAQIAALNTSVDTQAGKTYTITITDDAKLGESAKTVHRQLRTDLESLRDQIKNIRESLKKVFLTLKPDPKTTLSLTPAPSATPSVTPVATSALTPTPTSTPIPTVTPTPAVPTITSSPTPTP